ncbi:MAG: amidohydrolase [Rhodoferax sp.]
MTTSLKQLVCALSLCGITGGVLADGSMNHSLASTLSPSPAQAAVEIVIFPAKKVITMEKNQKTAQAVAVIGTRILGVGSVEQLRAMAGQRAFRVDLSLQDKIVMPGFIDQHLHPVLGALTLATEIIAIEDWSLPGRTIKAANSHEEYIERLKDAQKNLKTPDEPLISWGYHNLWHGKLNRAVLDEISSTRPIVIWQRSCHEVILNTAALKLLNITQEDVANKGSASTMTNYAEGHFWEQGFMNTVVLPRTLKLIATPQRLAFGLKQMVAYEHANGVTAYNEPGAIVTPEMWKLYETILGASDTPMYSTFLADGRGIVDQVGMDRALEVVEQTIASAPQAPGKKLMFFPKQIKLFADGAIISQLMQMKEPYADGHHGEWMINPDDLERRAKLFWDAGYQIHIHVNGDLGSEVVLATLEKRMKENPRPDHRFVVVHFANSTETQIARFTRNGAIFSVNPYYPVGFADKYAQNLGKQRADLMVRSASILKHTKHLSFHSDLPMAPSDPLYLAWAGVNRITPSGRVAAPQQRVSVDVALRAITIEAAYSWRKEELLGSIKPGKIANFTVLEQDPYQVEPTRLKDIEVWGTVFEGRVFPVPQANKRKVADNRVTRPLASTKALIRPTHDDHNEHNEDDCQLGALARMAALAYAENLATH